jgi:hypothetical protein
MSARDRIDICANCGRELRQLDRRWVHSWSWAEGCGDRTTLARPLREESNRMAQRKLRHIISVIGLTALIVILFGLSAQAQSASAADTCPEGNGWVKVEGLSGLTYTYTPPEGFTVAANCFKVGSHDPVYGSGPVVTNGTLTNANGQLQDLSHASFQLVPVTTTTQPTTTTTTAPGISIGIEGYCVIDQGGTGLAYMDFTPVGAAVFVINGITYDGPPSFGVNAQFGVNRWQATARPGITLSGPTEGTFTIAECGDPGTTTTTTQPTTTTTDPGTDVTLTIPPGPTVPEPEPSTVVLDSPSATLPFTGPSMAGPIAAVAGSMLGLGSMLVAGFRRRDDER